MRPTRRRPGPISTNVLTPSANMDSTHPTKSTEEVNWLASSSRASAERSGYLPPVLFAYTGTELSEISMLVRLSANGAPA